MNSTKEFGNWGEETAKKYLEQQGFHILETNWFCSHKEIDLIAMDGDTLVIIEVKTRSSNYTAPIAAVDKQKQKFLIFAANKYIQQKQLDCDIRFDVISIISANGRTEIEHIPNAFYPIVNR